MGLGAVISRGTARPRRQGLGGHARPGGQRVLRLPRRVREAVEGSAGRVRGALTGRIRAAGCGPRSGWSAAGGGEGEHAEAAECRDQTDARGPRCRSAAGGQGRLAVPDGQSHDRRDQVDQDPALERVQRRAEHALAVDDELDRIASTARRRRDQRELPGVPQAKAACRVTRSPASGLADRTDGRDQAKRPMPNPIAQIDPPLRRSGPGRSRWPRPRRRPPWRPSKELHAGPAPEREIRRVGTFRLHAFSASAPRPHRGRPSLFKGCRIGISTEINEPGAVAAGRSTGGPGLRARSRFCPWVVARSAG